MTEEKQPARSDEMTQETKTIKEQNNYQITSAYNIKAGEGDSSPPVPPPMYKSRE